MISQPSPVVVGVADDQPAVVRYAAAEANRLGRALRVVHCWAMPTLGAEAYIATDTSTIMRTEAERVLDLARTAVGAAAPGLQAEYVVEYGAPAGVLTEESKSAVALVLGSDDVPWFERFLGGELSGHLARSATCPVVVVPEVVERGSGDGGVVVTIDGDTSAAGPLQYGFEQADLRNEQLHVLHAAPLGTSETDLENHRANLAEVLAGWQEQFPGVDVLRSTTDGASSDACIAATSRASLVVIGRHHGRTTPLTLMRPIAMTVLREAQCPVVVVPLTYGRAPTARLWH